MGTNCRYDNYCLNLMQHFVFFLWLSFLSRIAAITIINTFIIGCLFCPFSFIGLSVEMLFVIALA